MFADTPNAPKVRIVLAAVIAGFAFTQWGFIWYATVFDDLWQSFIGKSEQELITLAETRGWIQRVYTYLISFVQALGLIMIAVMARAKSFWTYQIIALTLSIFIVMPSLGNAVLFAGQSVRFVLSAAPQLQAAKTLAD